jgi:fluoroacetyl-CoA thioesterase
MRPGLNIGDRAQASVVVGPGHTVPATLDAAEFAAMPGVLSTGKMVALMEWACIRQMQPFIEDGEGSLGTHIDVSHVAATPPGLTVTIDTEVTAVEGRSMWFSVRAHDGVDLIGEGRHRRAVVLWDRFMPKAMAKTGGATR